MKRRQSGSSNSRKLQPQHQTPDSDKKKSHRRHQSNNELVSNLQSSQVSQLAPGSEFGEEIEDQYYKTSIPSGQLMSPKRSNEAPKLSFNSGHHHRNSNGDDLHASDFHQGYRRVVDDLVDMEAEERQFAHLSVEDDDSNQDEDLMANFGIEVESEGGLCHDDNEDGGFNEADFKLFQQIQRQEGVQDEASDNDDMLDFIEEQDQPQYQLEDYGDTDDYGMKVGSPMKQTQHDCPLPASASPNLLSQREGIDEQKTAPFPERDASQVQMIRDDYMGSDELLQPMEILETDKTEKTGDKADQTMQEQNSSPSGQLLINNQGVAPVRSRGGQTANQFLPPIQIKSFVKNEGQLPSSLSTKNRGVEGAQDDHQSTSMLQETPIESEDGVQTVMVTSGLNGTTGHMVQQADQSIDQNAGKGVKVSQFTDQSKSGDSSSQHKSLKKFEFEREVLKQSQGGSKGQLSLTLGSNAPELINMQKLCNQTLTGQLGATQSDLNRTKGAELVLKDLLKTSPSKASSSAINRRNKLQHQLAEQQHKQEVANHEFEPEGPDTPESMNHYSKEDQDQLFHKVGEASDGGIAESLSFHGILEHKLPATFQQTINSGRSSIKPDHVVIGSSNSRKLAAGESKAYLEEKNLCDPSQRDALQSPIDSQGAFEFKTSINFEFKGAREADSDEDGRPLSPSSDQGSQESDMNKREVHTAHNLPNNATPSNAHEFEAVALESMVANPYLKSKTSMGFAPSTKGKKCSVEQTATDKAVEDKQPRQLSRVDQKRKLDTKLSIVRKNAEKLKQKRKDHVYQQSSSTNTRTRSMYNSSKGAVGLNSSTASTVPKPLNLTRLQISQKVMRTELERPNLPLSATKGRSQKTVKQNIVGAVKKQQKIQQPPMPNRFDAETKKVFHVNKSSIPKQAMSNAAKNVKQQQNSNSTKKQMKKQKLPSAMQKMITSAKKPQQNHNLKSKDGCLSQGTFEYHNYRQDHPNDLSSVRSHQATNIMRVESPNSANKSRLQTSAKPRVDEYCHEEEQSQDSKHRKLPKTSSQTSFCNQTNSKSLHMLKEKYGRGSPRVFDYAADPRQNNSQLGIHASPALRSPKAQKPSMASVFDRNNRKSTAAGAQKPPLSVKMTVAEVRAKEHMERQENVLRMHLEKIESKLSRKREEISKKREEISQNSRKTVNQSSEPGSLYGSIVTAKQTVKLGNKEATSFAMRPSSSHHLSTKGARKPSHSEVMNQPDSVAQSISKYKKKRMESLSALQKRSASDGRDNAPISSVEEEQKRPPKNPPAQPALNQNVYQRNQVPQLRLKPQDQSTKPVFESPRASIAITSPTQQHQQQLQQQQHQDSTGNIEVIGVSHRAMNDGSVEKPEIEIFDHELQPPINSGTFIEHQTNSMTSSQVQVSNAGAVSHTDQKLGFESIHDAMAAAPGSASQQQQQVKSPTSNGSGNGYHSLRIKDSKMKNGKQFESLRNYIKKTEKLRDLVAPQMLAQVKHGSLLFNDDICSPKEQNSSSLQQVKLSPQFNTRPPHQTQERMEATFNKNTLIEEETKSSATKKDQKSSEYYANRMSPRRMSFNNKRDSIMQQVTSPRVSLTPILKDSSQAKKMRRESIRQSNDGGTAKRSCLSQEKQHHHNVQMNPTETTMFKAPISVVSNTKDDSSIMQQQKPGNFFMSNLFKKLSHGMGEPRVSGEQLSDIRSQISRPMSNKILYGNPADRMTTMAYPTEASIMDMSATMSHTRVGQLPAQHPHGGQSRLTQQHNTLNAANSIGHLPSRQVSSLLAQNDQEDKISRGVDYIEESKDYQRVIHDLKSLLNNPRQHKPLKACSTSDISYLSHPKAPQRNSARPATGQNTSDVRSNSPRKMSPRHMRSIQHQLGVNQKRQFNPNAFISIGAKPQHPNKTLQHDRAMTTIEPAHDSISYSVMKKSPSRAGTNLSVHGQAARTMKLTKHKLVKTTHLDAHRYPSQTSLSVRSNSRAGSNQRAATSISLRGVPPGKIFNSSRNSQGGEAKTIAGAQMTINSHHNNSLTMAEQRRKEKFDLSLQHEVNAIEKVISHRQDQPRLPGHLKTKAQIDNYVDSLRHQQPLQNLPPKHQQQPMSYVNTIEESEQQYGSAGRSYLSTSPPVGKNATLTRHDQTDQMNSGCGSSSTMRNYKQTGTSTSPHAVAIVDTASGVSEKETEKKTQDLMRQIQQLQPMIVQAQQRNTEAAQQIQDLMELHGDIQTLQESQTQPQLVRPADRMTLHEMLPYQHVRMTSGSSLKNTSPSPFQPGSMQKYFRS